MIRRWGSDVCGGMKSSPTAVLSALALLVLGCDPAEPDDAGALGPDGDPAEALDLVESIEDLEALPSDNDAVVARYVDDDKQLHFISREDPQTGAPIIDVAMIASVGTPDDIIPLLDQGATPLELLLHLSPDAQVPEVMETQHRLAAAEAGRSPEVRNMVQFRDGMSVTHDETCDSWGDFIGHMAARFSPYAINTNALLSYDPLSTRHEYLFATTSSSDNVGARVCNPNSYGAAGGCFRDRISAMVYNLGAAGNGSVWTGTLTDCDFLKYWWGKRTADTQYGVTVSDPEYLTAYGWDLCDGATCGPVQTHFGVGFR